MERHRVHVHVHVRGKNVWIREQQMRPRVAVRANRSPLMCNCTPSAQTSHASGPERMKY